MVGNADGVSAESGGDDAVFLMKSSCYAVAVKVSTQKHRGYLLFHFTMPSYLFSLSIKNLLYQTRKVNTVHIFL